MGIRRGACSRLEIEFVRDVTFKCSLVRVALDLREAGMMAKGGGDGSNQYHRATGSAVDPVALDEAPVTLSEAGIDKHLADKARKSAGSFFGDFRTPSQAASETLHGSGRSAFGRSPQGSGRSVLNGKVRPFAEVRLSFDHKVAEFAGTKLEKAKFMTSPCEPAVACAISARKYYPEPQFEAASESRRSASLRLRNTHTTCTRRSNSRPRSGGMTRSRVAE